MNQPVSHQAGTKDEGAFGSAYFNRELSWLAFNERVLAQAAEPRHPLLERVRFIAIFSSNLDEFFMVRVGGLKSLALNRPADRSMDGLRPDGQLAAIRSRVEYLIQLRAALWEQMLRPALELENIFLKTVDCLNNDERSYIDRYAERHVLPFLTPVMVDPEHPLPHVSNLSLNLAVELETSPGLTTLARLKIPRHVPRVIRIPDESIRRAGGTATFVWIEDLILAQLHILFPTTSVRSSCTFRLIRDADLSLDEGHADKPVGVDAMRDYLRRRQFGHIARLEIERDASPELQRALIDKLEADPADVGWLDPPMDFSSLGELAAQAKRPDLLFPAFSPALPAPMNTPHATSVFDVIDRRDQLFHHPYQSFAPVVDFVEQAADDPHVVAIKQTLYRVGDNAPTVHALQRARRAGKEVTVLVELKARFDEDNNIGWARALEQEGVRVICGLPGLKTHSKVTLVVRRAPDGPRNYVHIGTGNYNAGTARRYTDLGLMTSRPDIAADVNSLFEYLAAPSVERQYERVLIAPHGLRERLIHLIQREMNHARLGNPAQLFFKVNSLTDRETIDALYEASCVGVKIRLIVRSACCLRPGIPGMSDNIEVRSVIGRFLEHSRVYYFENAGEPVVYIGSADLMGRNLDRRVETLVPVEDPGHLAYLRDTVLGTYWRDTFNSYSLLPNGSYESRAAAMPPLDSHSCFLDLHSGEARP